MKAKDNRVKSQNFVQFFLELHQRFVNNLYSKEVKGNYYFKSLKKSPCLK